MTGQCLPSWEGCPGRFDCAIHLSGIGCGYGCKQIAGCRITGLERCRLGTISAGSAGFGPLAADVMPKAARVRLEPARHLARIFRRRSIFHRLKLLHHTARHTSSLNQRHSADAFAPSILAFAARFA